MNRTVVIILSALAVLGTIHAAVMAGAEIRRHVLVSQCEESGRIALWQASSPDDQRPDGFLRFHCVSRESVAS